MPSYIRQHCQQEFLCDPSKTAKKPSFIFGNTKKGRIKKIYGRRAFQSREFLGVPWYDVIHSEVFTHPIIFACQELNCFMDYLRCLRTHMHLALDLDRVIVLGKLFQKLKTLSKQWFYGSNVLNSPLNSCSDPGVVTQSYTLELYIAWNRKSCCHIR